MQGLTNWSHAETYILFKVLNSYRNGGMKPVGIKLTLFRINNRRHWLLLWRQRRDIICQSDKITCLLWLEETHAKGTQRISIACNSIRTIKRQVWCKQFHYITKVFIIPWGNRISPCQQNAMIPNPNVISELHNKRSAIKIAIVTSSVTPIVRYVTMVSSNMGYVSVLHGC